MREQITERISQHEFIGTRLAGLRVERAYERARERQERLKRRDLRRQYRRIGIRIDRAVNAAFDIDLTLWLVAVPVAAAATFGLVQLVRWLCGF